MTHGGGAGLLVLGDGAEVDLVVAGDDDPRNLVAVGIGGGEVLLDQCAAAVEIPSGFPNTRLSPAAWHFVRFMIHQHEHDACG